MNKLFFFLITLIISGILNAQLWTPLDNGVKSYIRSMKSYNNKLYVGMEVNSGHYNRLGVWDGAKWDSVSNDLCDWTIYALEVYNNELYIADGCKLILKWNGIKLDTVGVCHPYGGAAGLYAYNNYLYAFGIFDSINDVKASSIARYDGTKWNAIDTTQWINFIYCARVYNNELYVGGNMWSKNGKIERLARWDGTQWHQVGDGIKGCIAFVGSFEEYKGKLYVAGGFNVGQGNPGNRIAAWDGTKWDDVGGGTQGVITALKVFNGELYAAGYFYSAGGVPIINIAKWDGNQWCGLGVQADSINNMIYAIEVYNNELYIGGCFKRLNGDTLNYIARWSGGNYKDTCGNATGIKELPKDNLIKIYPNPFNNNINIEISSQESEDLQIKLYNVTGNLCIEKNIKTQSLHHYESINCSKIEPGIYLLVLTGQKINTVHKIIKIKSE